MNRRHFLSKGMAMIAGITLWSPRWAMAATEGTTQEKRLTLGMVTDLHWNSTKETAGSRHYRESLEKLETGVQTFKAVGVDLGVNFGDTLDTIQKGSPDLATLHTKHAEGEVPWIQVLGNHDADMCGSPVDRQMFVDEFHMPGPYYSLDRNGVHLVVLDGNYAENGVDWAPAWNQTWIGPPQLDWLAQDLQTHVDTPTLIFMHQLAYPPEEGATNQWGLAVQDAPALRQVLEDSGNVLAHFSGHHHAGGYHQVNGIHYVTLKGMVEGSGLENNAYAVTTLFADGRIEINGFVKELDRDLT